MDDFMRLSDGDDDAARRVIAAMREEQPPRGAMQRALVAFGVSGVGMAAAGTALGSVGSAPSAGQSLVWIAIKWLSVGAAFGVAAGTSATALQPVGRDPVPPLSPSTNFTAHSTRGPLRASEQPSEPPVILPDDPAPAGRLRAPTTATPPSAEPSVQSATRERSATARFDAPLVDDTLAREIELLDEARYALKRKAPSEALLALDRFARSYPRGRLSAEAFVVRLDALVQSGRKAEARGLAERYLSSNRSSPHAARIRKLTGLEAP